MPAETPKCTRDIIKGYLVIDKSDLEAFENQITTEDLGIRLKCIDYSMKINEGKDAEAVDIIKDAQLIFDFIQFYKD